MKPRIIALYLPQYHPTPHNDEWWGKGFTEWTNVAKAKPLFHGHYQPKIPADLGFYDLRMAEVREQQAALAREAGIEGFCYYEYWFSEGHEELELPFRDGVESGKPDFPFCLCWANESWYKKFWNKDGAVTDKQILAEQTYQGEADYRAHFMARLNAFQDPRYMKVNNKLLYMIYKPFDNAEIKRFMEVWQLMAKEHGLPGFYFVAFTFWPDTEGQAILDLGFDAVVSGRNNIDKIHNFRWFVRKAKSMLLHRPRLTSYKRLWPRLITQLERTDNRYIPVMMPNWDHTPRSGVNGDLFVGCTPKEFEKHCRDVLTAVIEKDNPLVFIKSWNEWGEGNYMEPDLRYGKGYIQALRNAILSL